ncbi:MAG: glycine cleavage system aminomethyltransferase GcvT [Candidatus Limnocylindria bacterium]
MSALTTPSELKRTPLHEVHRELGARLVPFAGYEMPVQYTSILDEHRAVRTAVGLFDLSHMGELELRGPGAVDFLRYALVSDPAALEIGAAQYSMACEPDGGVIDDLIVYRLGPERLMVVCNASNRAAVAAHLAELLDARHDDATLEDRSDEIALIAPQGPRAVELLGRLSDVDLDGLANYHAVEGAVAGIECLVARTGYTGEDGFELFCDAARARDLWGALTERGSDLGLVPAGLGARDTLRLEAGMPLYGNELDRDTNPYEVNFGRVVKLEKRDFVGRDALATVAESGPTRRLAGLEMIDNAIPRAGYEVRSHGKPVGRVTSGTLSPTLGTKIAMAMVPAELWGVGNEFEIVVRDRPYRAQQVKLPFYRRQRD